MSGLGRLRDQAKMTGGQRMPARHIIHTVGPVYHGGGYGEAELLRSCYRETLWLASDARLETIAFPYISTGVYGYPKGEACELAISSVVVWLATHDLPRKVMFCCFEGDDVALYRDRLKA
jgi:O-acetyl-ADP-ribose deacetylase (regulator of RNase III)